MFAIRVKGGTGAGSKRPLREKPQRWACRCLYDADRPGPTPQFKPGYLTRCTACGAERP